MDIYLGADHGGFSHKAFIAHLLETEKFTVHDCGALSLVPDDDYPAYAQKVASMVSKDVNAKGILFCRSGEGMVMAANRFPGVRAAIIWNEKVAAESRQDNDANIAVLPADFLSQEEMTNCIQRFLTTEFSGEARHIRRIKAIDLAYGS